MTTFKNAKFKKSDDQMNIDKYGVAANITEYIIIPKFMMILIRQSFHVTQMYVKMSKLNMFKWTYGLFGQNY